MGRFVRELLGCAVLVVAGCATDDAGNSSHEDAVCAAGLTSCVCPDGRVGPSATCVAHAGNAAKQAAGDRAPSFVASASGSGALGAAGGQASGMAGAPADARGAEGVNAEMSGLPKPAAVSVSAGTGSAGRAAVGGSGTAGMMGSVAPNGCGTGGWTGRASNAGALTPARASGDIEFQFSTENAILSLRATLEVPAKPKPAGTVFLWPGLQPLPGGKNYNPVGNGVLQPVLTWGGTCANNAPEDSYANWWIAAQYVNIYGNDRSHMGCLGGEGMAVQVGDLLDISMSVDRTIWNQTVTDEQNGKTITYDIDMLGQAQLWGIFAIELPTATKPVADLVFTSVEITLASPEPEACQPSSRGVSDFFSTPIASGDGLRCCIARMALRAQGVAATTKD